MNNTEKFVLHLYCEPQEFNKIKMEIEKARQTDGGYIRAGDVLRNILVDWIEKNHKIKG